MSLFAMIHDAQPIPQSRARVTRFGTFYGKHATAHRESLAWELKAAFSGPPLTGPLKVSIGISGARADSDCDNHAKMVLDALQDAGVIASDDVRTVTELVVRVFDGEPRTVIDVQRGQGIAQSKALENGHTAAAPALSSVPRAGARGRRKRVDGRVRPMPAGMVGGTNGTV